MLILRRAHGQAVKVTARDGSKMVIRVRVRPDDGAVDLVFDDDACNFEIQREERRIWVAPK